MNRREGGGGESVGFAVKRRGANLSAKRKSVIMQLCASCMRGPPRILISRQYFNRKLALMIP